MLRFLWRFVAFLAEMNGYTPFFQALFKAYLAIIVGGLSVLSGWVCSVFGKYINNKVGVLKFMIIFRYKLYISNNKLTLQ